MRLRADQEFFTAEEVCALLGIEREKLNALARSRHIGRRAVAASPLTVSAEPALFDRNDLAVLVSLAGHQVGGDS